MAHSSRASTRSSPTKVRRSKKASKPAKGSTEAPARKISSLALDALDEFHRCVTFNAPMAVSND